MIAFAQTKQVIAYRDKAGFEPFTKWLEALRDDEAYDRIVGRLKRLNQGNYGDCEPVGEGVHELRLFYGPGYRLYFGERGEHIVILLCGGDKKSQKRDIKKAQAYWKEYVNYEKTL